MEALIKRCDDIVRAQLQSESRYEDYRQRYETLYAAGLFPRHWLEAKLEILPFCAQAGTILDVGSLTGGMAFLLHDSFKKLTVISIDNVPSIIRILEPYQDERLSFICQDVFACNDRCDMVVADQAIVGKIEPFKKILEKLQNLARTVLIAEIKPNVLKNIIRCENYIDDNIENEIDTGYREFERHFIATFAKTRIIEQTYYKVWIGERERS